MLVSGGMDDHLSWREEESELIRSCGIFDLRRARRVSGRGRQGWFYLLEAPDWINVVPVLKDAEGGTRFLMVKQFRHGIREVTVEFPAGLVQEGEALEEAARRELLEETGYRAGSLRMIGRIRPNPAFMSNWCYTYTAERLERSEEQNLDELEELEVLTVPVPELVSGIGTGVYCNSMTFIALQWYLRYAPE